MPAVAGERRHRRRRQRFRRDQPIDLPFATRTRSTPVPTLKSQEQTHHGGFIRDAALAAPLLLLVGAVLTALELIWLGERGVALTAVRAGTVAASIVTAVSGVALGVLGCLALGRRLAPRWPAAVLMLAAVWPAYLVVQSLFAGGFVRDIPSIGYIKTGAALLLVGSVPIAVWIFRTLARIRAGKLRRALAIAAAASAAGIAYFDTHFQVGLYPAAHYLLAAAILYCAALAATLAAPSPAPRLARRASAAAAGALAAVTVLTWNTQEALTTATYSDGLMPKIRGGIVGVAGAATALVGDSEVPPALDLDPQEFRFRPTQAFELDEIRGQVRNVVFVLADAFRNDHVGMQREGRTITPFLDELGAELIRFQNAYAGSDRTGQSMPVLMTSYPLTVIDRAGEFGIPLESWVDRLRARGYRTFANGNCDYLARKYPHVPLNLCYGAESVGVPAAARDMLVPEVLDFVAGAESRPFAVFTHWMDTHILKTVKDPRGDYASMVANVDSRLRDLVEGLERLGHRDDTLIVITADHGYGLGENLRYLGNQCCAELQVRVPLLLVLPGSAHRGRTVEQNVAATDVVPTILDVLAPDEDATVGGRSLLGLLYDDADPRLANDHTVYTLGIGVHMVRRGELKLHWNEWRDTKLVVNVAEDPQEMHPIVFSGPGDELWRSMRHELEQHARLAASLAVGDRDIDGEVVVALLSREVDAESVAPFLDTFWERSPDTQRALLQATVRYRLDDLADALDSLTRDAWTPTDQLLVVTRSVIDARGACTTLAARLGEMAPEPRRWAGEVYPYLSSRCRSALLEPLLAAIRHAHKLQPALEDPEGHFLALAAATLPNALATDTPRDIKELLRDLFNAAVEHPTRYRIPSVRGSAPFDRTVLLAGLERSLTAEEIDILAGLAIDKYSAEILTRLSLRMNSSESRELLMRTVHAEIDKESARSIILQLRRAADDEMRRAAADVLGERFPMLYTGIDEDV